jgi:hypothetical protein
LADNFTDRPYLRFVYMPERKEFKQVMEGKDAQFFFKQVSPQRAYTLEVFDGVR